MTTSSARKALVLLGIVPLLSLGNSIALAGGWFEVGDAPEGVPDSQVTQGNIAQSLIRIDGNINQPAGDHVDTYQIVILDPSSFSAFADSNFDSRLFLWDQAGNPLLSNEGTNAVGNAFLTTPANFVGGDRTVSTEASGISLSAGGTYLISISTTESEPEDSNDLALFDFSETNSELVGPGAGVGPFDAWDHDGGTTNEPYTLFLGGATFAAIPEPSMTLGLIAILAVSLANRRIQR